MLVEINGQKVKLPDFFIVGAAKSGTTSLAKYLSEHPEIYIPEIKEPQFFAFLGTEYNNNKPKPFSYVRNLEGYALLFNGADESQILGEASTWYSIPQTVDRTIDNIFKIYKDNANNLKFIFIIRNPLDRLLSAYNMYVSMGLEDLPFEEAVFLGKERIAKGFRLELNYIENMLIADSVERYLNAFGKENVKIYLYEELKNDPSALIKDIFEFLGVASDFSPPSLGVPYNSSGIMKSQFHKVIYDLTVKYNPAKPIVKSILSLNPKLEWRVKKYIRKLFLQKYQMPPKVRNKLKEVFKKDIAKLQKIIDKDLSHWLE